MNILINKNLEKEILNKYNVNFIFEKEPHDPFSIDALIFISAGINKEVIDKYPNIKIIGSYGVGYDHIDHVYAKEKGIAIVNTPTTVTYATAETTIGLMLNTMRKFPLIEREIRESKDFFAFKNIAIENCFSLRGKTLGIVGFGRIGKQIGKIAHAFGMKIIYNNNRKSPINFNEYPCEYADFEELIKIADIVTVICPYTKENYHLFSHNEFKKMKNTAIFVNAGRGKIHDEKALIAALKTKEIMGCGLDVYEFEPEISPELWEMENVVLLPHAGTYSNEVRNEMLHECISGCVEFLKGNTPNNLV